MAKYEEWIEEDGLIRIAGWARDGLSLEQIADNIGISKPTLYAWIGKYPKIAEAIKQKKDIADRNVENALYKSAVGYEYEETKKEYEDGELIKETIIKKVVPPNVSAAALWLKNRKPDQWRDKQEINVNGTLKNEQTKLDNLIKQLRGDEVE